MGLVGAEVPGLVFVCGLGSSVNPGIGHSLGDIRACVSFVGRGHRAVVSFSKMTAAQYKIQASGVGASSCREACS